MPLQPGARLGPYEVLAPLGVGGMGEVYRARDTRLQREVAVKVLPELFAADPERLARFQREAQLLASLNHPNIGSIYGFEEAQGVGALVLELVDGPTLADRLLQGPIPIEDALPLARQVVDALEAAHERGIIHRDLKPANIKLRPDRTVKVLDFGLAKALEGNARTDPTSPTITSPAVTRAGVVLGTAAYMAPEQAKGRDVDRTADVWAFGCVLYEMLGGRRPFDGESVTEVLAGVLKTEPDWRHLPANTPEAIRRLLRRCLQKESRQRLQHIGDARLEIDEAQAAPRSDSRGTPIPSRNRERLTVMVAGLVALVTGVMLSPLIFKPTPPGAGVRLEISTPPTTDPLSLAISPDGQKVVFAATSDGRPQLWLRRLDSSAARPLAGTDFGTLPFWSPDSRSIAFFADGKLKRMDIQGGPAHEVANASSPTGGTWNHDDTILFAPGITGHISRISLKGGEPSALTGAAGGQFGYRYPQFLPDGKHFLYYLTGTPAANGVYVGALDRSVDARLVEADTPAVYAASGHLLFVRQGTLLAQRFDPVRLTLTGDPIRVAEPVPGDALGVPLSASAAGPIVYRAGSTLGQRQFIWVDRAGKELERVGEPDNANALSPTMSSDGRLVAFHRVVNGNVDIWWSETARWGLKRATTDPVNDIHPLWSPDASRIIYASRKKGVYDLYERSIARPDSEATLLESPLSKRPLDWSPDGRLVLYRQTDPKTGPDIWALPLGGSSRPFAVVNTDAEDTSGKFSPDGKWIAYESNRSGRPEVFVRAFPGPGAEAQVSVQGGAQVRWAPHGRELFFIALDGRLMSAAIKVSSDGQTVEAGACVPLFATKIGAALQLVSQPQYMVSPDGKRFLMNSLTGDTQTSPIAVLLNWKSK